MNGLNRFLGQIMRTCLTAIFLAMASFVNTSSEASENIVHKLKETGILTIGTRSDTPPFAFQVEDRNFAGFTIDIIEEIANGISDDLRVKISTKLITVTVLDRFQAVQKHKVDMVCGSTTPTWEREAIVDFSVPFFIDGIRILTFKEYGNFGVFGLQTKTVGVLKGSTSAQFVPTRLPNANIKTFTDSASAMAALEAKEIDAMAGDGIALEYKRVHSKQESNFMLVPKTGVLVWQAFSCVLPENQSKFRDLVNIQFMKMLNGLENLSGTYAKIYFRWFGGEGVLNYPLDETRQSKLLSSNIWLN
tara:strand:+ start:109 stop:1020 length:912 start_codon:yes stop_codon:yes gene_type:complete